MAVAQKQMVATRARTSRASEHDMPAAKRVKLAATGQPSEVNLEFELECIMNDSDASTMCPSDVSSPSSLASESEETDSLMQTPTKKRAKALSSDFLESPVKCAKPRTVTIVGRTAERSKLDAFLQTSIERTAAPKATEPKALYVSGGPGTGKTCCVRSAVADLQKRVPDAQLVEINCMMLQQRTLKGLMSRIAESYAGPGASRAVRAATEQRVAEVAAQQLASTGRSGTTPPPVVLLIDEVDQLVRKSGGQAAATAEAALALEGVFSLPNIANSNQRVAVIAIANAVDLLERTAGRELIQKGLAKSMLFEPYSTNELREIFKFHLSQTEHGKATEEALGKVGLETRVRLASKRGGSCRTLLGLCNQALGAVATSSEFAAATKKDDATDEASQSPAAAATPSAPHLKAPPKSNQNDPLAGLKEIPIEQQILLCALANAKTEVVKVTDLCNGFRDLLSRLSQPVTLASKGNVSSILNTLEAKGLLEMRELKTGPGRRQVGTKEMLVELCVSRKVLKRTLARANEALSKFCEE